ncbi:hypothetical protein ACFO3U_03305 [Flavobacterium ponti]|uniref:Uncharacterized protein n=1 Tax=Flavobacterium ponti TaxID=665133 RepID=A0ABV9P4J3_9FLAO
MNFKQLLLLIFGTFLFFLPNLNAQEKEDYLTTYDSIIGKENLAITNGLFHSNNFRVNDNKDIYFMSEKFTIGSLNYINQLYFDVYLKYDAYNDELVYRPSGRSEKTGVNIIKANINSFQINGIKFININNDNEKDKVIKGFYEEKLKNSTLSFYIKHYKSKREVFVNKNVLVEFSDETTFVVKKNNIFSEISSKTSISKIFPEKRKIINEYYKNNSELKKKNKTEFFTNLLQNISQ